MKTAIALLLIGYLTINSYAQNMLDRQLVATTGNYTEGQYTWLSYSVGEPVVFTGFGTTTVLTQGFQQPENNTEEVNIHIYSGFTPNGDGDNDSWYIDHIYLYPDNSVAIFDRWGVPVWQANGYNNKDVVWKGDNNVSNKPLTDGTYFYVIKINDKTFKGWVELTK